jgi:hypothetical protein
LPADVSINVAISILNSLCLVICQGGSLWSDLFFPEQETAFLIKYCMGCKKVLHLKRESSAVETGISSTPNGHRLPVGIGPSPPATEGGAVGSVAADGSKC